MNKKFMKVVVAFLLCVSVVASFSASAFANSWSFSSFSSTRQTAINNAYYNYILPNEGYEVLSLSDFQDMCTAFSSKSSPSWSTYSDWYWKNSSGSYTWNTSTDMTNYRNGGNGASILARMIYAENTNVGTGEVRKQAMRCTAKVAMNRADAGWNGSYDVIDIALQSGQFSSMNGSNVGATNPTYYTSDLEYWAYACWLAHHICSCYNENFYTDEIPSNYYYFYDTNPNSGGSVSVFKRSNRASCTSVSDIVSNAYYYGSSTITNGRPISVYKTIFFNHN